MICDAYSIGQDRHLHFQDNCRDWGFITAAFLNVIWITFSHELKKEHPFFAGAKFPECKDLKETLLSRCRLAWLDLAFAEVSKNNLSRDLVMVISFLQDLTISLTAFSMQFMISEILNSLLPSRKERS